MSGFASLRVGRSLLLVAVIAAAIPLQKVSAAIIDSSYTGAAGGLWSTLANWSPVGSPINNPTDQFHVTIASIPNVNFDIAGSNSINDLALTNAGLTLNPGDNLTVLNSGSLTGSTLFANGANFSGNAIATVTGTDLTVFTPGAITLGGITAYTTQSDSSNHAWFSGGTGATLSADSLTTIHLQGGGLFFLQAHNSGLVSFPAFTTLDQVGTRLFTIQALDAGTVNIPAFGSTAHANVSLDIRDGGTVSWGAPATLTGSTVGIRGASTINTSALSNADGSNFSISNGSISPATPGTLSLPALVSYTTPASSSGLANWSASGAGSSLSANALTIIHLLPATAMYVTAQAGATVNFNALNAIDQTGNANSALILHSYGAGSTINIPAFGSIIPSMGVDIRDGGTVNWGAPTSLTARTSISVGGAATINLSALTNVDGATFDVNSFGSPASPGVLSLPPAITSYSTPNDNNGYGFAATGPGSVFSANALQVLHLAGAEFFYLSASSGGTVNLNALTTLDRVGTRSVNLHASGASSVVNIPGMSLAATNFEVRINDGGTINWGSPTTFTTSLIAINGDSNINTSALTDVDGSRFDVSHGFASSNTPGHLSLPAVTSYTTPNDSSFFSWNVSNNRSSLSLDALTTIHAPGKATFHLTAQTGATLNLNALTTIDHSGGTRSVIFDALGGFSVVNLASLHSLGSFDSVHLSNGGTANLGGFTGPFTVSFAANFFNPGGPLDVFIDDNLLASIPNLRPGTTYHTFSIPGSSSGVVRFVSSDNPSDVTISNYLATAAVPEPASLALVGLAAPLLLRRGRPR